MTYSIVARDLDNGDLGVAVQSRAFASGSGVPWAEPDVGAIATQALGERSYGPLGLALLRAGKTAEQTLAALVADDAAASWRQVAIVGAAGDVAVHTGENCIPDAGSAAGPGFSAQANCCRGSVWEEMANAFAGARGTLARRLLEALVAGEQAGGDFRGRQAAALLVRPAGGRPWERVSDLRVDDHPEPLAELRRLLDLEEGYRRLNRAKDDRRRVAAEADLPDLDIRLAAVLDAAAEGRVGEARELLRPLIEAEPRWRAFVRALERLGEVPDADALLEEGT